MAGEAQQQHHCACVMAREVYLQLQQRDYRTDERERRTFFLFFPGFPATHCRVGRGSQGRGYRPQRGKGRGFSGTDTVP